jgi:hypothetical protein
MKQQYTLINCNPKLSNIQFIERKNSQETTFHVILNEALKKTDKIIFSNKGIQVFDIHKIKPDSEPFSYFIDVRINSELTSHFTNNLSVNEVQDLPVIFKFEL